MFISLRFTLLFFKGQPQAEPHIHFANAIQRKTHQVVSYSIGNRSKKDLKKVTAPLKMLHPKRIVTDKLNVYPNLVKPNKHDIRKYQNNHIERANLTLREHLKRLSGKTLSLLE